ncbi:MAG: oligosaccharide flippase family protein [Acidimicrobiia bacterium]|nr:oligosaccharide flippase family protein [Acidimicrobiia bacterium]
MSEQLETPLRSIRSNAVWTFAANAVFSGMRWLTIVVLVRWGSSELVGQYVLGLAITQPIFMLAGLDMSSAQATDAKRDFSFREYSALRSLTVPLAVAVTAGLLFFLDLGSETSLVVMLIAGTKVIGAADLLYFGVFAQHERLDKAGKTMIGRGVLGLAGFVALLLWTGSLPWALVGMAAGWLIVLAVYAAPQSAALVASESADNVVQLPLRTIWRARRLRQLAWLILPLGIAALLSSLTYNIPRYVVQAILGNDQLGVFAAVAYIVQLVQLFAKSFRHATAPRLAKYYAMDKMKAFSSLLLRVLIGFAAMSIAGVIIALAAGDWFLTTLYGPEYAEAEVLAIAIAASGLLTVTTFMNAGVLATRRFGPVLTTRAVGALAALFSGLWLVPTSGLQGAAWSLLIGYGASSLTAAWFLRSAIAGHQPAPHDPDGANAEPAAESPSPRSLPSSARPELETT